MAVGVALVVVLLGGSWDLVSMVFSTSTGLISNIRIVTLIITLVTNSHDPLSSRRHAAAAAPPPPPPPPPLPSLLHLLLHIHTFTLQVCQQREAT